MEITKVDASAASSNGYTIDFISNNVEEATLPASFFSSRGDNVLLSSSLMSQTAIFRGRNKTVHMASRIFSITVVGESHIALDDPVIITFEKTETYVSTTSH